MSRPARRVLVSSRFTVPVRPTTGKLAVYWWLPAMAANSRAMAMGVVRLVRDSPLISTMRMSVAPMLIELRNTRIESMAPERLRPGSSARPTDSAYRLSLSHIICRHSLPRGADWWVNSRVVSVA